MAEYYLWVKSLHVIAFIFWLAGMLALPLIMKSSPTPEIQKLEHNLLKKIINPAMLATFVLGIWLIVITRAGAPGTGYWLHVKLVFIIILIFCHVQLSIARKKRVAGETVSPKKLTLMWGLVIFSTLIIPFLAVVKPF